MENEQSPDIFFMRAAITEAQKALEQGEVPIGAVIAAGGRIVARGHNLVETLGDPTAHAEMQAITAATAAIGGKYLNECTLYVTIEPCPMCASAAYWARIGRIVYGAADPKRGFSTINPALIHPKTKLESGLLSDESAALMSHFFAKKRD
jgi:tRNA(adenine34) deaminase